MAMNGKAVHGWLLGILILHLLLTISREVFDFIGRVWLCIIANFLELLVIIFAIFGTWQLRSNFLKLFIAWCPVWLGWNVFLIAFYLNVGVLDGKTHYLAFNTSAHNFWQEYVLCKTSRSVTSFELVVSSCVFDYWYVEIAEAGAQCLLTIVSAALTMVLLCMFLRKLGGGFGTLRRRDQPRITMELTVDDTAAPVSARSVHAASNGIINGHAVRGAPNTNPSGNTGGGGYQSDTTGYLNASYDSNSPPLAAANGYLPNGHAAAEGPIKNYRRSYRRSSNNPQQPTPPRNSDLLQVNEKGEIVMMGANSNGKAPATASSSLDRQEKRRRSGESGRRRSYASSGHGHRGEHRRHSYPHKRSVPREHRSHSPAAISERSAATTVDSGGVHYGQYGASREDASPSLSYAETAVCNLPLGAYAQNNDGNNRFQGSQTQLYAPVAEEPTLPTQQRSSRNFKHVPASGLTAKYAPQLLPNAQPDSARSAEALASTTRVGERLALRQGRQQNDPLLSYANEPRRLSPVPFQREMSTPLPLNSLVSFDPKSNTLIRYHERDDGNAQFHSDFVDRVIGHSASDWPAPPPPYVDRQSQQQRAGLPVNPAIPIRVRELPSNLPAPAPITQISHPRPYDSVDAVSFDSGLHTNSVVSSDPQGVPVAYYQHQQHQQKISADPMYARSRSISTTGSEQHPFDRFAQKYNEQTGMDLLSDAGNNLYNQYMRPTSVYQTPVPTQHQQQQQQYNGLSYSPSPSLDYVPENPPTVNGHSLLV